MRPVNLETTEDIVRTRGRLLGDLSWRLVGVLGVLLAVLEAQAQPANEFRHRTPDEQGPTGATLDVRVSADGTMRLDGVVSDSSSVSRSVRSHIRRRPSGSVRFGTERGLPYEIYVQHLDTLKAAYLAEWDEISLRDYGILYERLKSSARDAVRAEIPLGIVLEEPRTDH